MEKTKYKIEDPKKFIIAISLTIILIIALIFVFINGVKNKNFIPSNNSAKTQTMFSKKNILKAYNTEKSKEEFLNLSIEMQEKISMWLLSNVTKEKDSFDKGVQEINKELKKHHYEKYNIDPKRVDFWIGDYSLDKTGKLTFKFSKESIKPNWVKDENIKNIVI